MRPYIVRGRMCFILSGRRVGPMAEALTMPMPNDGEVRAALVAALRTPIPDREGEEIYVYPEPGSAAYGLDAAVLEAPVSMRAHIVELLLGALGIVLLVELSGAPHWVGAIAWTAWLVYERFNDMASRRVLRRLLEDCRRYRQMLQIMRDVKVEATTDGRPDPVAAASIRDNVRDVMIATLPGSLCICDDCLRERWGIAPGYQKDLEPVSVSPASPAPTDKPSDAQSD